MSYRKPIDAAKKFEAKIDMDTAGKSDKERKDYRSEQRSRLHSKLYNQLDAGRSY